MTFTILVEHMLFIITIYLVSHKVPRSREKDATCMLPKLAKEPLPQSRVMQLYIIIKYSESVYLNCAPESKRSTWFWTYKNTTIKYYASTLHQTNRKWSIIFLVFECFFFQWEDQQLQASNVRGIITLLDYNLHT